MFNGLTIKHFYILVIALIYITFLLVFHFKIKNDPELKSFFLDSLRENGKPSGKSLTGMFLIQLIGFATIVAIIYAPDHLLPEYFLISLLTFIGGLYGMKVASKYINNGDTSSSNQSFSQTIPTNNNTINNVNSVNSDSNKDKTQTNNNQNNNNSQIINNDDIG